MLYLYMPRIIFLLKVGGYMNKTNIFIAILFFSIIAIPFNQSLAVSGEEGGAVIGGIVGGLIGNQFGYGSGRTAATIGGVLVGGFLGSQVGRSLDRQGRHHAQRQFAWAFQRAMTTGRTAYWHTDQAAGRIVVSRIFYDHGRLCRRYTAFFSSINGRDVRSGMGCKEAGGYYGY